MATFTSGKYAKAECDRCGDKINYLDLVEEWTGLMVCTECLDIKDPLDFPTNFPVDPESLKNPRPTRDVSAGEGVVRTQSKVGVGFKGIGLVAELGNVTVTVV